MLFTPRAGDTATDWIRQRSRGGDTVLLRGHDPHGGALPGRTQTLTRKATFAALPAHEARLRLITALAALDNAGLRTDGFAPPRWLASRGTVEALRDNGFAYCADLVSVQDLRTGEVLRARVQGFGSQNQRTETLRCFALVLSSARAAKRGGLVRLGVDAEDLARPGRRQAFLDVVDVALENGAIPRTYSTLRHRVGVS